MGIGNHIVGLTYGMEKDQSAGRQHPLGTVGVTDDGRWFRYAQAGEAIGAGQMTMQAVSIPNHDMDLTTTAAAVGAVTVTVTLGATLATASQYADGYLYTNDDGGEGHVYKIKSHPAAAASGSLTLTFYPDDGVKEAISGTPLSGLMVNPYKGVEIYDANDVDGPPLGVAQREVTTSYYFWAQTQGYGVLLCDASVFILGNMIRAADTDDGAGERQDRDEASANMPQYGVGALIAPVDTDYGVVYLQIGP